MIEFIFLAIPFVLLTLAFTYLRISDRVTEIFLKEGSEYIEIRKRKTALGKSADVYNNIYYNLDDIEPITGYIKHLRKRPLVNNVWMKQIYNRKRKKEEDRDVIFHKLELNKVELKGVFLDAELKYSAVFSIMSGIIP